MHWSKARIIFCILGTLFLVYMATDAIAAILPPLSSVSVNIDKSSPQQLGSSIKFSATATGSTGDYEYSFILWDPYYWEQFIVQDYSTSSDWVWDTAGYRTGTYTIQVMARNIGSTLPNEAVENVLYTITPPEAASGTPLAVISGAPSSLTNLSNPVISVSGNNVVAYKYKLDNRSYSAELPVNIPIKFSAEVTMLGATYTAGTPSLQAYLDSRANNIGSITMNNVTIDTPVVFLLNKMRVALEDDNILNITGSNLENLALEMNTPLSPEGDANSDLASFSVSGGRLFKVTGQEYNYTLEILASSDSVAIKTKAADPRTLVAINGILADSGSSYPVTVYDGANIIIETTAPDGMGTNSYSIKVHVNSALKSTTSYSGYYLKTYSPQTDYIRISNRGAAAAKLVPDLNNSLLASNQDIYNEIMGAPPEFIDEPLWRRTWRFVRDNRYHWYPISPYAWSESTPAMFFNSIGFGFCDDSAVLFCELMTSFGYQSRVWGLNGHVVAETYASGRWEMYDPDLQVYYYNRNGQVANVAELATSPELITNPINPVYDITQTAYSQLVAGLYSSSSDNVIYACNSSAIVNYTPQVEIPAGGTLEFPAVFASPVRTIESSEAPSYTNARLNILAGWTGSITTPFVIHSIGYDGPQTLSVIAKDINGNWQALPTTSSWTTESSTKPVTKVYQSKAGRPVTLSANRPAIIFYTTDGTTPTKSSPRYRLPIEITAVAQIKFFAIDLAGNSEAVRTFTPLQIVPPSSITLTMTKNSPQMAGTSITFSAVVSGGSGDCEYYYTYRNPVTAKWYVGQSYSSSATWIWDTSGFDSGVYSVQVWARSVGSTASYEVYKGISYTLNPSSLDGVTLTMDRASPQTMGAVITYSAAASGGTGNYQYYFRFRNNTSGMMSDGQAYSSNSSWSWNTSGVDPGSYTVEVLARNAGANVSYEAIKSVNFVLFPPANDLTLTMDKISPLKQGTVVNFSAAAGGGSGSYDYSYRIRNQLSGNWSEVRPYEAKASWVWNTVNVEPGSYIIEVLTRNAVSTTISEAERQLAITVTASDGDVDDDGQITIMDALRILRIAIGMYPATPIDLLHGDVAPLVNGQTAPDGRLNITDALFVFRKALGMSSWQEQL